MNGNPDINQNFDSIFSNINLIVDVLEKNGRINSPASDFFPIGDNTGISEKEFEELTKSEIEMVRQSIIKPYIEKMHSIEKTLQQKITQLNALTNTTTRQYRNLKKQVDRLTSEQQNLQNTIDSVSDSDVEQTYNDNRYYSKKNIQNRWNNGSDALHAQYGSYANYEQAQLFESGYNRRKDLRREASDLIASSGLGNTGIGRFMQSAIGIAQTFDSTKMFNQQMQNGGAETMAKGLFGDGQSANAAAKGLKGVGSAVEAFGGPLETISLILSGFMAIVKLFGKVVAEAADYIANEVDIQTDVIKSQFEFQETTLDANANMQLSILNAQGALKMKEMDVRGENMLGALKIVADQYAKSHEIAAGNMFDGINETVYKAAEYSLEAAGDIRKYQAQKAAREKALAAQRASTGAEIAAAKATALGQKSVALAEYEAAGALAQQKLNFLSEQNIIASNYAHDFAEKFSGTTYGDMYNAAMADFAAGRDATPFVSGNLKQYNTKMSVSEALLYRGADAKKDIDASREAYLTLGTTDYVRSIGLAAQEMQLNAGLAAQATQAQQQAAEAAANYEAQRAEILADAAVRIKKAWLELAKNVEKYLGEHDKQANNSGIGLGFTDKGSLFEYKKAMLYQVRDVGSAFGKEIDEIVNANSQFAESTGRNKVFTTEDTGGVLSMGYALGDTGLATQVASAFEIFNHSTIGSMNMLFDAMNKVNRTGLNFRAYTKNILNNIQMAQKYNFVDGLKGFMRMARWATNARMNMSDLSGAIDKIQEGGLEGALSQSAGLTVLGGKAAINADPLSMFYEGWSDAEAYAHRIDDMVSDFGSIDLETGETKFNIAESMHVTRIANMVGMSVETLFNQIRAKNKAKAIDKVLKDNPNIGANWSDEFKENVTNRAFYDRGSGQWKVKVKVKTLNADGHEEIDYQDKALSELNQGDAEDFIMPDDYKGRVIDYMRDIVSIVDMVKSAEIKVKADIAAEVYEEYIKEMDNRIEAARKLYQENRDVYIKNAKEGIETATRQFNNYIETWKQGNSEIDQEVNAIGTIATNLGSEVGALATAAKSAWGALSDMAGLTGGKAAPAAVPKGNGDNQQTNANVGKQFYYSQTITPPGTGTSTTTTQVSEGFTKAEAEALLKDKANYEFMQEYHGATSTLKYVLTEKGAAALAKMRQKDSFIPSQGQPMLTYAQNAIPIGPGERSSDATIVQTDPRDSAIFAKPGGKVEQEFKETAAQVNTIGEYLGLWGVSPNRRSRIDRSPNTLHNATIMLTGVVDVECDEASFDITQYLTDNPLVTRQLFSEMTKDWRRTKDGGRKTLTDPSRGYVGYS